MADPNLERLERFHETMPEEDRRYLSSHGFNFVDSRRLGMDDISTLGRPYFVLSLTSPFRFHIGSGRWIGVYILDPRKQSKESLAGLIEETAAMLRTREDQSGIYPNPRTQAFLVCVLNREWKPVVELLKTRYPCFETVTFHQ